MDNKISFPHIENYYIPIKYIIEKITKCEVIIPSLNNKETIEIGEKYSPSNICMPFKYNLGNYINALNKGATILIQAGGGCIYGYYAELQSQILEDLGYNFRFVNLIKNNHVSIKNLYLFAKSVNEKLNIIVFIYYLIQGILMIIFIDKIDNYKRINQANIENIKIFDTYRNILLKRYSQKNQSIYKIIKNYLKYNKKIKLLPLTNNEDNIKILLIGELFTLMDSTANNNLEKELLKKRIKIYRYTDLTYLLLKKKIYQSYALKKSKKYIKYRLGADGTESVYHALKHCKMGIDGIIHIKSYGCIPELNAIPILNKISEEYKVPILYLSFDGENNVANIDTKLEAFYDMINAQKRNNHFF